MTKVSGLVRKVGTLSLNISIRRVEAVYLTSSPRVALTNGPLVSYSLGGSLGLQIEKVSATPRIRSVRKKDAQAAAASGKKRSSIETVIKAVM